MAKSAPECDPAVLAVYDRMIEAVPEVERKGAKSAYTSLNGHMFSFVTKESTIALRFGQEAHDAFVKKFGTSPVIQYGAVMRGYVEVPAALLAKPTLLAKYFQESSAYIGHLPPSP